MAIPGYVTIQQASKVLKIDETQVRRYCVRGDLRATKVGRSWLIVEEDVISWEPAPRGNPNFVSK